MDAYRNIFMILDSVEHCNELHKVNPEGDPEYWRVYETAEVLLDRNPEAFEEWINEVHSNENCYDLAYTFFQTLVNASSDDELLLRMFKGSEPTSMMFRDITFPSHMKAHWTGTMVDASPLRSEDIDRANQFLNANGFPTGEVISTTLRDLQDVGETEEWVDPELANKMMDRMYWNLTPTAYSILYLTAVLFYVRLVCNYRYQCPFGSFGDAYKSSLQDLMEQREPRSKIVPDEMCRIDGEFELDRVCFKEVSILTNGFGEDHTATFYKPHESKNDFAAHQEIIAVPGALFGISYGDQIHKIKLDYERMTREQADTTRDLVIPFVRNLQNARETFGI
jgi:hypothetical protein